MDDLSNAELLRQLQSETTLYSEGVTGSQMVGELDWLQDWLEEGPSPLKGIHVAPLKPVVVSGEKEWEGENYSATAEGQAVLSLNPSATVTGTVNTGGENTAVSATGQVNASRSGIDSNARATGAWANDNTSAMVSAEANSDGTQRSGQLTGSVVHEGTLAPGVTHNSSVQGTVAHDGESTTGSVQGQTSGTWQGNGATATLSAQGKANSDGQRSGSLNGSVSHQGEVLPGLAHNVGVQGTVQSDGSHSGRASGQLTHTHEHAPGVQQTTTAKGSVDTKGLKNGKLSSYVSHKGETNGIQHSVKSGGMIDNKGNKDLSIQGRVGSQETHQEGDALVTTGGHMGAGASLKNGVSGEVGMFRRSVEDGERTTTSGKISGDKKGAGLSLSHQTAAEKSRTKAELAIKANVDGSTAVTLGGEASAELYRAAARLSPEVSVAGRALGASAGAGVGLESNAEGERSLTAKAHAALTLAEGTAYAEKEVLKFGEEHGLTLDGRVHAAAEARADANASLKLDKGVAVEAAVKAFVGAKAEASTGATITWDRKDDYGDMLRDFADNLPGTWDDKLLDQLPDSFWTELGTTLFGKGQADLLRVGVGVDGRAGLGAEASLSGGVNDKGMFETDVSLGGALGVGGGARMQVGFNPIDTLRKGLVESIEAVNTGFALAESAWQHITTYFDEEIIPEDVAKEAAESAESGLPDWFFVP